MKATYKIILAVTAAIMLPALAARCEAAEASEKVAWPEGEHQRQQRRFELPDEAIKHIMEQLAKDNPAKAKELKQLRKEDPKGFRTALRAAVRGQFGEKFRERMKHKGWWKSKQCSQRKPSGGRGAGITGERPRPMRKMAKGQLRDKHDEYVEWLKKSYPENAKKLTHLRGNRPKLYGERLRLSLGKYGKIYEASKENPELGKILKKDLELKDERDKLLRKITAAGTDYKKKELAGQLEEVISSRFDLIVQRKQMAYETLLNRLKKLERQVKQSEAGVSRWKDAQFKNENVKARLEELVSQTKKFKWD